MEQKMDEGENLAGKYMVVTGATSGLGFFTAQALAGSGAAIIGVGRSKTQVEKARSSILAGNPHARVKFLLADLASQRQVRGLADQIQRIVQDDHFGILDVLINNAGTVANWFEATEDGYELQFAVNHLAPFLLTHELLPLLLASSDGRIITVSSTSHRFGRIYWKDVMLRKNYHTLRAYQQSKLANVLFTFELNRRLKKSPQLRAYAADPGLVNTEIGLKGTSGLVRWVWERRRKGGASPGQGARTAVMLATDPSVNGSTNYYWKNCQPLAPSRYAQQEDAGERLWALSERLCGIDGSLSLDGG